MKNLYLKIKQWFKSWTVNFGLILSIVGALQLYYQELQNPFMTMLTGVLVILLRFKTTQPVSEK